MQSRSIRKNSSFMDMLHDEEKGETFDYYLATATQTEPCTNATTDEVEPSRPDYSHDELSSDLLSHISDREQDDEEDRFYKVTSSVSKDAFHRQTSLKAVNDD